MKPARAILVGACAEGREWVSARLKRLMPGGPGPGDFVVGIDGGVDLCLQAGILPDLAVGDWDSLRARRKKLLFSVIPSWSLPREKDRSDLHFGLEIVRKLGIPELVCLGVTGGRIDHHLAALFDLGEFVRRAKNVRSLRCEAADAESHFIRGGMRPLKLRLKRKGALLSLFAWGQPVSGVSLTGLRYRPRAGKLLPSSHGLSNEALRPDISISIRRGVLLAIVPHFFPRL